MNRKSINFIFFLTLMACPALFGMMKRTIVTPKVILPASFLELAHSYFSPSVSTFSPTVSTFPQYDTYLNQDTDAKNRWYKSKWFKYPLLATLIGVGIVPAALRYYHDSVWLDLSDDAAHKDPELYELFLQIKKDYGIIDHVNLRILRTFDELNEKQKNSFLVANNLIGKESGMYLWDKDTIVVGHQYKKWNKSKLIYTLAHQSWSIIAKIKK